MKKSSLKLVFIVILLSGLFTVNSNAQPIDLGGGLVIGTDRPNVGLKIQGNYGMDFLLENLSGSAAFTIFFPATPGNITYSRWSIDVDGHYKFYEMSDFEFYAVGGLNIAHYKSKWDISGNTISSGTKPGLNVGAGAFYKFSDKMKAFSEFKYILSNYDQAEITFGVLFEL
jgi:opacity protein-like surface antigen